MFYSILDSSCGDMNWMPIFLQGLQGLQSRFNSWDFSGHSDIKFTGYDLLPVNIDQAKRKFSNESWSFEVFDLVEDRISQYFDIIISRHTSIHLGLMDNIRVIFNVIYLNRIYILQMFHNFYQSGSKFLVATTFPNLYQNTHLFLPGNRK